MLRFILAILLFATLARPAEARPPHTLRIFKAERRMQLEVGGKVVRAFQVGLGGAPEGDKERQGDMRTPEGEFYVAWKNPRSSFHRFLGLSYPMPRHAEHGVSAGLIQAGDAERIRHSIEDKKKPPQFTNLGGLVGIHGGGAGSDWTLGCIAVSDDEIEWLYSRVEEGDSIVVLP